MGCHKVWDGDKWAVVSGVNNPLDAGLSFEGDMPRRRVALSRETWIKIGGTIGLVVYMAAVCFLARGVG